MLMTINAPDVASIIFHNLHILEILCVWIDGRVWDGREHGIQSYLDCSSAPEMDWFD